MKESVHVPEKRECVAVFSFFRESAKLTISESRKWPTKRDENDLDSDFMMEKLNTISESSLRMGARLCNESEKRLENASAVNEQKTF